MTTYEPGTVAVATVRGVPDVRVHYYGENIGWITAEPMGTTRLHRAAHVTDIRPLVVLDPEDREQVERLLNDYWARVTSDYVLSADQKRDALQAALRSLTRPPKPAEPTGLGAVVEDARGVRWTRVETGPEALTRNPWYPSDCEDQPAEYADINAVRILSEGVS